MAAINLPEFPTGGGGGGGQGVPGAGGALPASSENLYDGSAFSRPLNFTILSKEEFSEVLTTGLMPVAESAILWLSGNVTEIVTHLLNDLPGVAADSGSPIIYTFREQMMGLIVELVNRYSAWIFFSFVGIQTVSLLILLFLHSMSSFFLGIIASVAECFFACFKSCFMICFRRVKRSIKGRRHSLWSMQSESTSIPQPPDTPEVVKGSLSHLSEANPRKPSQALYTAHPAETGGEGLAEQATHLEAMTGRRGQAALNQGWQQWSEGARDMGATGVEDPEDPQALNSPAPQPFRLPQGHEGQGAQGVSGEQGGRKMQGGQGGQGQEGQAVVGLEVGRQVQAARGEEIRDERTLEVQGGQEAGGARTQKAPSTSAPKPLAPNVSFDTSNASTLRPLSRQTSVGFGNPLAHQPHESLPPLPHNLTHSKSTSSLKGPGGPSTSGFGAAGAAGGLGGLGSKGLQLMKQLSVGGTQAGSSGSFPSSPKASTPPSLSRHASKPMEDPAPESLDPHALKPHHMRHDSVNLLAVDDDSI